MLNQSILNQMEVQHLQMEVIKLRNLIRYHRDQKGTDRCWLDDDLLYESLPEATITINNLPSKDVFLSKCLRFHSKRQAPSNDKQEVQKENNQILDEDIKTMTQDELKKEINRLQKAIRLHRNVGDNQRTWQDDQRLYDTLKEEVNYDNTLPTQEEFMTSCNRFFSTKSKTNTNN